MEWVASFYDMPTKTPDKGSWTGYIKENYIDRYDIPLYAIAYEESPKFHIHVLIKCTKKVFTNFNKKIVEDFNLRRTGKGGVIKYGKVKKIRDLNKMLSYTLKDGVFESNIDKQILQEHFEASYKKDNIKEQETKWRQEVMEYCLVNYPKSLKVKNEHSKIAIYECIIALYIEKGQIATRSKVEHLYNYLIQYSPPKSILKLSNRQIANSWIN